MSSASESSHEKVRVPYVRRLLRLARRRSAGAAEARDAYYRRLGETWPAETVTTRRLYEDRLSEGSARVPACAPPIGLRMLSFSCERDLPEQVASIHSFFAHVGTPTDWTIASDGSHSSSSRRLLEAIHPSVEVRDWRAVASHGLPRSLWQYAETSWRGKKLLVMVSFPVDRPVLYTDADIFFFPPAHEMRDLLGERPRPRYLRDCDGEEPFLDTSMLTHPREAAEGVNAGLIFTPDPLDWTPALARLERRLRSGRAMFTGQTVVHLTLRRAAARPFDAARYVLAIDDRSLSDDPYVGPETVLRHYVTPVRHKFWSRMAGSLSERR